MKCPKCGNYKSGLFSVTLKQPTLSTQRIEHTYQCKKCSHMWTEEWKVPSVVDNQKGKRINDIF